MGMVRHDRVVAEVIAVAVEVMQSPHDDRSDIIAREVAHQATPEGRGQEVAGPRLLPVWEMTTRPMETIDAAVRNRRCLPPVGGSENG